MMIIMVQIMMMESFSEIETAFSLAISSNSNHKVIILIANTQFVISSLLLHSWQQHPQKSNLDYYRGRTKSVYEREPVFKDFARNIPLSQQNLWDNANLTSLKKDFQRLLATRNLSKTNPSLPDPLRPLTVASFYCDLIPPFSLTSPQSQPSCYRPVSKMLGVKHQSRGSSPVVLPKIYVYHRFLNRWLV